MGARRTDYSEDEDVEDATESESGSDEDDDVPPTSSHKSQLFSTLSVSHFNS